MCRPALSVDNTRMTAHANRSETVDGILTGAFDLNVLAGPDHYGDMRLDALDTARYAQEAGLDGFLLISDHYPTGPQAQMLNRVYPGLTAYGSVTLNKAVGGMNASAVEAAAGAGARAVLMPAADACHPLDPSGSVTQAAETVLDAAVRHGLIVASGMLTHAETVAVFGAARERGVTRAVASHCAGEALAERFEELASLGAYVEHSFAACMPGMARTSPAQLARNIRAAGVESSILTSGFGQWYNPPPAEGLRMAIAAMLAEGVTPDELEILVKRNPMRLLGREDE